MAKCKYCSGEAGVWHKMSCPTTKSVVYLDNSRDGDTPNDKEMGNLTFGQALEHIKNGVPMQRTGWNGKGMFIFARPEFVCKSEDFAKIQSVSEKVKEHILAKGVQAVKFTGYLCMFAADGTVVNGWLASQTDMLADDWQTAF